MNKNTVTIGMDIGGTKILLEAFDSKGKVCQTVMEKTATKNAKVLMTQIITLLENAFHKNIKAIGVAVPGIVEKATGTVAHTPHLPLRRNFPLRSVLEKHFGVPVMVDNDINAFLFAEKERKELKGKKNIVAIMVGTGVGSAMMTDGRMIYGHKGFAGEAGHMVIDAQSPLKTLEQNVGGYFIPKIAKKLGIKGKMTAYDLNKKTPEAQRIKKALVENLGIGLANLNLIFNPNTIVLGGSIYHLFIEPEKRRLEKIITEHSLDGKCPKLLSARKNTSVAEGVALMAKKEGKVN